MPLLSKEGVTQSQLDALTTPCVVSCTKSVKVGGSTNYGVEVLPTGTAKSVRQTVYLPDGRKYTRYYNGSTWIGGSGWKLEGENLNLECKIVAGTVYIRHGKLPEGGAKSSCCEKNAVHAGAVLAAERLTPRTGANASSVLPRGSMCIIKVWC